MRHRWAVRIRAAALAAALLAAAAFPAAAQDDDATGLAAGAVPPAATVQTLAGASVDLASVTKGGPTLIEFWATWCPICRALEPRLVAAHARYGSRVRFVVVAVAVNECRASVARHLDRHPLPFDFYWDADGGAVRAFDAPSTSYVVVLDAHGRVAYTGTGSDQDLDAALAKVTGGAG